ncbi:MAG TPA: hypothetical protein ENJ11_09530 [Gammaproteobacteria bacterium]|nr:hypothetical protein [Gammaproteobacteria bacterium]
MVSFKAVIAGILTDIAGSIIAGVLVSIALVIYLVSNGADENNMEAMIMENMVRPPWSIISFAMAALVSLMAGYVTAKVAKVQVYYAAGIVALLTAAYGFYAGLGMYSHVMNAGVSVFSAAIVMLGAWLWRKRNPA